MPEPILSTAQVQAKLARAEAATPGPWVDATDAIRRRHAIRGPKRWRARQGHSLRNTAVFAILGAPHWPAPPLGEDFAPGHDEYDYHNVYTLYWWALKGTSTTCAPLHGDLAFIAAARTDLPALAASHEALRAIVGELLTNGRWLNGEWSIPGGLWERAQAAVGAAAEEA